MPEENTPNEENNTPEELTIESIETFDPENLNDDQKSFLEENKGELTDEQIEKFGLEKEDEDDTPVDIEPEDSGDGAKGKDTTPTDDDEIDPEDEKTIGKVVDKKVGSAIKELESIRNQNEVATFIRLNPAYAKYENSALKFKAHPNYKNLSVGEVMAIVSAKDAQRIGAQKEREASKKAKETQGGGSQVRTPSTSGKDYKNMSKEDFEKEKAAILQGAR